MVQLVKRLIKGTPLSYEEMDGNLDSINNELSNKVDLSQNSISIINAVQNIKGGVAIEGDTLLKLHILIKSLQNNKLEIQNVINNLTSLDIDKPLSAYQGKLLKDELTQEINNRIALETMSNEDINDRITLEINNRISSEFLLSLRINNIITNTDPTPLNSLSKIVTAFQNADNVLRNTIDTLTLNLNNLILTEKNRAISIENFLQDLINTEVNNRISAITDEINNRVIADNLKINITDIVNSLTNTSLNKPLSAYQGKILKDTIDSEILLVNTTIDNHNLNLNLLVNNETINRIASDENEILNRNIAISDVINLEKNERDIAIGVETTNRINALVLETNDRIQADNALSTRIDNIVSNTDPAALDSLTELVNTFQNVDNDLLVTINTLTNEVNSNINQETINRQNAINDEVTNRNIAIAVAIADIESRLYSI